ncbi:MAG: hypothetical protein IPM42_11425 [Saprospiraceae bacterium]|nr:hypothetical protein [Saprospiraceae bacterium]
MNKIDKFLELEQELKQYKRILGQAADIIINENVSKYPIFVIHQQEVEMGIALVEGVERSGTRWSVNASTLEEFVTKGIVFEDKLNEFRETYKDPENFLCLFVLSELGAQFIFLPR